VEQGRREELPWEFIFDFPKLDRLTVFVMGVKSDCCKSARQKWRPDEWPKAQGFPGVDLFPVWRKTRHTPDLRMSRVLQSACGRDDRSGRFGR
jgi:hypothetical protein